MCGIAGIVARDELAPDACIRASAMGEAIVHRGPDETGLHHDRHAVLAHRRLSIVDLKSGQQPLSNERRDVWVVFNGEIYNHRNIRQELESLGHRYRTASDTETIVHAYEEWGDECVERFRGMFAFAIWDQPKRRLLLVRDRLGIKPLYWTRSGDALLFASEIKALLASGLVERRANEAVLPELLGTRYVSGSETMFAGVNKLLPGHLMVFEDGETHVRKYWDVPVGPRDQRPLSAGAEFMLADRFRSLLEESVRLRLMSDVPLGMFLSGGIDSSAIAVLMAGMIDRPLKTFSVAFKSREFSELEYSRRVAAGIKADAHEVVIDDYDFFGALPRLVWHEDEPLAHPSSVPLYCVSRLAREHVTVVLTGEGSDELLAGYGKYPRIIWNWRAGTIYERMCPRPIREFVARQSTSALPGTLGRLVSRSFLAMARTPGAMCFDNFASIRVADQASLLRSAARGASGGMSAYAASTTHFDQPPNGSTLLDRMLYADMKTYLVELLMKQDQMSMAASIESRVPFLDHKLVEFAAALPDSLKLSGWTTKRVLRLAMKGVLPDAILNRPKMGFPVPFSSWTRGEWHRPIREVLLDRRSRERGILEPAGVEALLRDHASGRADHGDRLWALLNLELWYRTFIDGDGVQTLVRPSHAGGNVASVTTRAPRTTPAPHPAVAGHAG